MNVAARRIAMTAEKEPAKIPWGELGVDIVVEATGVLHAREALAKHLEAGAKKVDPHRPGQGRDRRHDRGRRQRRHAPARAPLVSNASCTTNCLAPIAKILDESFGIEEGFITTVHAYTNDQRLADVPHKDLRRSRAAAENIIPTTTGAARAVGKVLPQLKGKLDGIAMRVPVPDGSIVDLVCRLRDSRPRRGGQRRRARRRRRVRSPGIVEYSEVPLVSSDIIGNPHSSIFDALSTKRRATATQGDRLVRQRVGLLQPRRGPRRPPRGRRRVALAGLAAYGAAAAVALALANAPEEPPRGRVTEKIVCGESPDQSYALYLPSAYDPSRPAPILYMLDARGRALVPIERFREAAEEHGWILVSSYNTRSDTEDDPNTPAVKAIWKDTHARLAIDDRRVSLTGFWAGARASASRVTRRCGSPGSSGAAPAGPTTRRRSRRARRSPTSARLETATSTTTRCASSTRSWRGSARAPGSRFSTVGTTGLRQRSPERRWRGWSSRRCGAAPAPRRGSDRRAVRPGPRPRPRARGRKPSGRRVRALRMDRARLPGSDRHGKAEAAAELGGSAQVRKELKEARRRDERDRATLRDLSRKLSRAMAASNLPPAGLVAADLRIPALKTKAASAESVEERLSAERILANLRVQTSFYAPGRFLAKNDAAPRLLALSCGRDDPDDPHVYYNLACAARADGPGPRALRSWTARSRRDSGASR